MKSLYRKTSSKLFPLARITPLTDFQKMKLVMKAFTNSINVLHTLNDLDGIKNPNERFLCLIYCDIQSSLDNISWNTYVQ